MPNVEQFTDLSILNDGIKNVIPGGDLIKYLDGAFRNGEFYWAIINYFSGIMTAALLTWGFLYFLKSFWDMLRGQETWDEFFVFVVKKSIPVIVLFFFVWPHPLPPGNPYGIQLFNLGEQAAFNLPKHIFGVGSVEEAPFKLASRSEFFRLARENLKDETSEPQVVFADEGVISDYSGFSGIINFFKDLFSGKDVISLFILQKLLPIFLSAFFKFGFVIIVFVTFIAFYIQVAIVKLKFILFAPLFYLSTILLLFDRYRDIFWGNFKLMFVWALQPTFLVLAYYGAFELGLFSMLLFVHKQSPMVQFLESIFTFKQSGVLGWIVVFIVHIMILVYFFKLAVTVPAKAAEAVMNALNRIVTSAFRTID